MREREGVYLDMVDEVLVLSFDGFNLELQLVYVKKSIHDDRTLFHLQKQIQTNSINK